ncbi:MAG TPA: SDR family oxidoreductase [Pontiella sp.]|nr:SDR family oxidoreductase [Pontiella sp.]
MSDKYLIFGATSAVGSETARGLRERGAEVHLAGRSAEKLAALAGELDAAYTVMDVTDSQTVERTAAEAGNCLAGLVYAVGTINLKRFQRLESADYLQDFQVNALGAALAIRAALPALRSYEGVASVVLYSSVAARTGFAMHASIGMAKAAVNGLTVALAAELSPAIRVNTVAPSLLQTPLAGRLLANEKTCVSIARAHPLERLGTARDIASATLFLLSETSSWITGQVIGIDGGRSTLCTVV